MAISCSKVGETRQSSESRHARTVCEYALLRKQSFQDSGRLGRDGEGPPLPRRRNVLSEWWEWLTLKETLFYSLVIKHNSVLMFFDRPK